MMRRKTRMWTATAIVGAMLLLTASALEAQELVLAENGETAYQIVVPDESPDAAIAECLRRTARLIQTAFKANGFDVPITSEGERDPAKPCIYLGDTTFARANGVDASKLEGWDYVHKAVGRDVILAGRDHAPPVVTEDTHRPFFYRIATLKAVTDFLRQYVGTCFLYPGNNILPSAGSERVPEWNLVGTATIEYEETPGIRVPSDLDVHSRIFVRYHTRDMRRCSLYDIANNLFPRVDDALEGHTYPRAVPAEKYREKHPEYFALIGGKRTEQNQYCVSNEEFQELLYEWTRKWLDMGFRSVNILQPDGFRPCQCEECRKLYNTGDDWGEKLWIFHRKIAERLQQDCPGKKLLIAPYTVTLDPPQSFDRFPDNVIVQHVDANFEETDKWKKWRRVHSGEYAIWLHNWVANQTSRYTPMRTPLFIEKQVRFFHDYNVRGIFRDGMGYAYGLEGPTYYVFGRMFDDPENLQAKDLMLEFCRAAFGSSAPTMRRFYDRLHHAIELYSLYLGTHGVGWAYRDIYGKGHKHVSDPFRMLGLLYPPDLLKELEKDLSLAEDKARDEKVKMRLGLVRREFNYLKALMRVIHLYRAYETAPSLASRDRLLDAIDERNALILDYYDDDDPRHVRRKSMKGWPGTLFPPPGHSYEHLKLGYNRYQGAFKDTALNWDTDAAREAPLPDMEPVSAKPSPGPPSEAGKLLDKARNYRLNGLNTRAIELYRKIVNDYPQAPEAEEARSALRDMEQ